MKTKILFLVLGFSLISTASAERASRGDWEIGPYAGVGFLGDYGLTELDPGPILGLRVGHSFTDRFGVETSYHRLFADGGPAGAVNVDSFRLNLLYNLDPGKKFRPFVTVGAGVERIDLPASDESNGAVNAGLGFRYFISERGGVRFDARYIPVDAGGSVNAWQHDFEVLLSLFVTPKSSCGSCVAVAAPVAAAKTAPVIDGDADGDGVKDSRDRCPNSPQGAAVDGMGCSKVSKARGVLKGVEFKTASDELTNNAKSVLDEVAKTLQEFPNVKAEVEGHTDSMGDEKINLSLSQARAKSVQAYLAEKGVTRERLSARGYGESRPLADNASAEGRQDNRRVELRWIE